MTPMMLVDHLVGWFRLLCYHLCLGFIAVAVVVVVVVAYGVATTPFTIVTTVAAVWIASFPAPSTWGGESYDDNVVVVVLVVLAAVLLVVVVSASFDLLKWGGGRDDHDGVVSVPWEDDNRFNPLSPRSGW